MLKGTPKQILVVAAGVFIAGLIMNQFSDVAVVEMAKDGYK